ncbi:MAG: F0F1 ATP synthase subunit B [Planctomycetota bacterium]
MGLLAPVLASGGGGLNPLNFDSSAFLLTIILLLILFGLLMKFAWNPILDALDAREKRIEDAVGGAEKARREAEEMLADYKRQLADAERQVAGRIEEGKAMAARQAEEIVEKARSAAEREVDGAKREIEVAKQRALLEMRTEAVGLSRMIAEKVLAREVNAEDHRRLADEVLSALK